jgi:hypothetical protein
MVLQPIGSVGRCSTLAEAHVIDGDHPRRLRPKRNLRPEKITPGWLTMQQKQRIRPLALVYVVHWKARCLAVPGREGPGPRESLLRTDGRRHVVELHRIRRVGGLG